MKKFDFFGFFKKPKQKIVKKTKQKSSCKEREHIQIKPEEKTMTIKIDEHSNLWEKLSKEKEEKTNKDYFDYKEAKQDGTLFLDCEIIHFPFNKVGKFAIVALDNY